MLKLEEKQKLIVFRNETKGGTIYYTASFGSTIKVDGEEKDIYYSLPVKCSKENTNKLEKIFKNGASYTIIHVGGWVCCFEIEIDKKKVTRPALLIQTIY